MSSVRQRFIRDVLEDEGRRLIRNQSVAIMQKLKPRTGRLVSARSVSVSGGDSSDGVLTFRHTAYERFLDMKSVQYGSANVRRNRRIHNRFVFGHYHSIAERLAYGLTEDVAAQIRKNFNNEK